MPPRYSMRPHTLWMAVLVGTVLAAVLTVSHIFVTIRNMSRLRELLPTNAEYSTFLVLISCGCPDVRTAWEGDDRPMEVPIPYAPAIEAWEDPAPALSLTNDSEWGALFPKDGSVRGGATNRTFLVAMVHQLHCLDVIRVGYVTNASSYRGHIEHCLRYLVASVQCSADTTLEEDELVLVDGKWMHAVYAWGTPHKCRDRTALNRYLIENEGRPHIPQQNLQDS